MSRFAIGSICFLAIVFTCQIEQGQAYWFSRGDFIPERKCATLFSAANFQKDSFKMKDFDQSGNLKWDYRASSVGWMYTASVQVESCCKLTLCNETYFQGSCHLLDRNVSNVNHRISLVRSAKCTCERESKCEDVFIGQNEYGRAYLGKDCSSSDSEYYSMKHSFNDMPELSNVNTLVIRRGCSVSLYFESQIIQCGGGLVKPVTWGPIRSYNISCFDDKFCSRSSFPNITNFDVKIDLPMLKNELYVLLKHNINHPGLGAALTSALSGRSAKNAYVVIIETRCSNFVGFLQCSSMGKQTVSECTLPVNLDHLGIVNSKVKVISVAVLDEYDGEDEDDYSMMATLDKHLSTQVHAIPNAVIIAHSIKDNDFSTEDSDFQKKLEALHLMRRQLVDENYSNVIVLLDDLDALQPSEQRNPEARIAAFRKHITQNWSFPSPLVVLPIENIFKEPMSNVNGYRKMRNEEYWPKNLESSLETLCKNAGDPLGQAIFKAYFLDKNNEQESFRRENIPMLPAKDSKVADYRSAARSKLLNFMTVPFSQDVLRPSCSIWNSPSTVNNRHDQVNKHQQVEIEILKTKLAERNEEIKAIWAELSWCDFGKW